MIRKILLIVLGIALLCLQVLLNPSGYNYGGLFLLAVAIAYFDEVKSISALGFKLEKYTKIAEHIDESIVSNYRILLNVTFYMKKSIWDEGGVLLPNYNELRNIFEDIAKLPNNLKDKLNIVVKDYATKSAYLQISYLEGTQKLPSAVSNEIFTSEIPEPVIPDELRTHPDLANAREAYRYLVNRAKNGV